MAAAQKTTSDDRATGITRQELIEKLNEDLSREYQAIIAYPMSSTRKCSRARSS
jgi:hypothetical protein